MSAESTCPPEHQHGVTCYRQHGCRCRDCRVVLADYARNRYRLKAQGRFVDRYVPAAPVREHVLALKAQGVGWSQTATLAGVKKSTVARLLHGRTGAEGDPRRGEMLQRISRDTADRILAVRADLTTMSKNAKIPARGARRRMQALMARGWSRQKIARQMGMLPENFHRLMLEDSVTVRVHLALAETYERIWNVAPPTSTQPDRQSVSRAMNEARRASWPAPLAWDDIDEDETPAVADEEVEVDEVAVELAIAGESVTLTPAERRAAVRELNAVGRSDGAIAAALTCNIRTVERIREELSLPAAVGFDRERIVA